ncbi:hypothetical protein GCM10009740_01100 [Terrabacter terrae]|uniref:Uncharacterized protein n=1 Tax=Terrabacter terrae TaxID=318434 RepID=A0ABP5FA62_9MICO
MSVARRVDDGTRVEAVVGRSELTAERAAEHGLHVVHELARLTARDPARDPELTRALLRRVGTDIAAGLMKRHGSGLERLVAR